MFSAHRVTILILQIGNVQSLFYLPHFVKCVNLFKYFYLGMSFLALSFYILYFLTPHLLSWCTNKLLSTGFLKNSEDLGPKIKKSGYLVVQLFDYSRTIISA